MLNKTHFFTGLLASAVLLGGMTARASAVYTLRTEAHEKYLNGMPDGRFHPSDPLTRAQAAAMVYQLMETPPEGWMQFSDVAPDVWYARAAGALARAGLMSYGDFGEFRPDDPLTRRECAVLISGFIPEEDIFYNFTDLSLNEPTSGAIYSVVANGLMTGDETGAFRPEDPLTRAEAAVVFNRLLGRAPDPVSIAQQTRIRTFPDVPKEHWAYAAIMEAATTHEYRVLEHNPYEVWTSAVDERPRMPDGFHTIDGWLYYVQNGEYVTSQTVNGFAFDDNGRYTSGSAALDETMAGILREQTNSGMSRDEKLRALYNYVSRNFSYIKRDLVAKDAVGWQPAYAASFFADGRGNCFSFAAAFQQLARAIGVDAQTVVGHLGRNRQDHGWVEIVLDGTTYVFDPELEMVYRSRGSGYDLFRFPYSASPFDYWK